MKRTRNTLVKSAIVLAIFTLLCGVIYPAVITGAARLLSARRAGGSMIEVNGKVYGSELLGQRYTDPRHLWGRAMNIITVRAEEGTLLMYAEPSNLSPASESYAALIEERVKKIREANPERGDTPVPVDLVTVSGSGLDPHISPAAAEYQVPRIAKANGISDERVREIIAKCSEGRLLGILGENRVNVLKVNLMLDGKL